MEASEVQSHSKKIVYINFLKKFFSSTNFQRYIYDLSHQQHGAQIQRFQKWYDIKEKDFELGSFHPKR